MRPARAGRQVAAVLLLLAACESRERRAEAPAFSDIRVASRETPNGATPMFLVASNGARILAWVSAPGGGSDGRLQLSVTLPGAATPLPTAQIVDPLGPIEAHGEAPPQLAADAEGTLYALYTVGKSVPGERFPRSALRLVRSEDGGRSWSAPVTINEGEAFGSHNFHALLAGPKGRLYAAWLGGKGGASMVWLRRSEDGGRSWHETQLLHADPTCPCCRSGLALGPDGTLYAAWRNIFAGDVRDVVVARSRDGGATWDPPVRPRADGWVFPGCPHAGPSLRVDAAGAVHIAWWTGKGGSAGVYYARSDDGGKSFMALTIAVGERSRPSHVQLAVTATGPVVVWDDGQSAIPRILLRASEDGGRSFGKAMVVSAAELAASFPVVGIAGDSLRIAWSSTGTAGYEAAMAEEHHHDAKEPMGLPRVGQREILERTVPLAALVARPGRED
jgi:hypothetical protein